MARRREISKRKILPDPKYKDLMLAKFINVLMKNGKKSVAEKIVYVALGELGKTTSSPDVTEKFKLAIDNVGPIVEVKSRRVGGSTYQVPVEVKPNRKLALAMRWLVDASRKRREKGMALRLAGELFDATQNKGAAVKKKEDAYKMAEANRAFSHFRW